MGVLYSYKHFTDESQRVDLTISSQDSNYIASGIYNDDTRATTWRTAGCWVIDSSNNKIVFTDGGGNLTATLTSGTYNSDSEFFAHVKTQMESVGANTYTIARDSSTKKIDISSDTSGFEILWTDAASNTADLFGFSDASDSTGATLVSGLYTYTAASIRLHTEEYLIFDFGSPVNPAFFAALGPTGIDLPLSESATIKVMFNNSSSFTSPAVTLTATYDSLGIFKLDSENGIAGSTYRYMKFQIIDRENAFGFLEFSKVIAGSLIPITRGAVQFPVGFDPIDFSISDDGYAGQSFGRENATTRSITLRWFGLDSASKEYLEDHFMKEFKTYRSFFVFFDKDAVFSSRSARSFFYCKYQSAPPFSLRGRGSLWEKNHRLRVQL